MTRCGALTSIIERHGALSKDLFSVANMAEPNGSLAQDTANLHLDEVTGERVSKSELKKRERQRQLEEKKKAKAAAAPPKPEKKSSAEIDESNLNPNV